MSRIISVKSGSVQFRIEIYTLNYLVDVWSEGAKWKWTAKLAGAPAHCGKGVTTKWSESRTTAFRCCVKHAKTRDEAAHG